MYGLDDKMDLQIVIESLRKNRPVFHSEADFQFALAWEIKTHYPNYDVRLEYPCTNDRGERIYVDILVRNKCGSYPIELKYKTKERIIRNCAGEDFNLREHGAENLSKYDFVKDICRIESIVAELDCFKQGYTLWLTNNLSYCRAPRNFDAGYAAFSVHQGAQKTGTMDWGETMSESTKKGRTDALVLRGKYTIDWKEYSNLTGGNGKFKYSLVKIST